MSDLLFREWVVLDAPAPLRPGDLCSVHVEPTALFRDAAREYRDKSSGSPATRVFDRKTTATPSISVTATASVEEARERLRAAHPDAFVHGFRTGALGFDATDKTRERGGYPSGFHQWASAARNAWFAGWYAGAAQAQKIRGIAA